VDIKPNLEIDLFKSDWIVSKCINSYTYSQNLYAAMCNNLFYKGYLDSGAISHLEEWSTSWRGAGKIIADLRNKGERYIYWYCSGMADRDGYLPESVVSDEVREDLLKLGWTIKPYENKKRLELGVYRNNW
jgi:hypothetical protein